MPKTSLLKCNKCIYGKDRVSNLIEPEKCSYCINNPEFIDNFSHEPVPWPPEEGQKIWCISTIGDVFQANYNIVQFVNLVNAYPTENAATKSREILLNARFKDNETD